MMSMAIRKSKDQKVKLEFSGDALVPAGFNPYQKDENWSGVAMDVRR